ncbi:unnamed protein product [Pleuronectes platessa]|uniref:Uncharacterized protein n=1 Tax=Pleuronectes platessa TaxID=8262 RepID=A0A9N7UA48_PLEPL|nr:unnamed protein product [Pleuronectes platessa]
MESEDKEGITFVNLPRLFSQVWTVDLWSGGEEEKSRPSQVDAAVLLSAVCNFQVAANVLSLWRSQVCPPCSIQPMAFETKPKSPPPDPHLTCSLTSTLLISPQTTAKPPSSSTGEHTHPVQAKKINQEA